VLNSVVYHLSLEFSDVVSFRCHFDRREKSFLARLIDRA
jgi:hypothetical protein